MKFFTFFLLFSTVTFAATKLELPLTGYYFVNHKEVKISVPKLNKELAKLSLSGLPETIVVTESPKPFWTLLKKRIAEANKALDREMHFNIYDDNYGEGYLYKMSPCYRGSIADVPQIIAAMNGNFLNPEQGILAIAAGKKKVINDEAFESREGLKERFDSEYATNLKNINKWLNYNENSKIALVMSDYGPQGDGTELEVTTIPACE